MRLAAIVGPVVAAALLIAAGLVQPGYSHVVTSISALAGYGSRAWTLQLAGFEVMGLSLIVLAVTVARAGWPTRGWQVPTALAATGLLLIASGFARCSGDPCPTLLIDEARPNDVVHWAFALPAMVVWIATPGIAALTSAGARWYRRYSLFALLLGIAVAIGCYGVWRQAGDRPEVEGLWQRLVLIPGFTWYVTTAVLAWRGRRVILRPATGDTVDEDYPGRVYGPAEHEGAHR